MRNNLIALVCVSALLCSEVAAADTTSDTLTRIEAETLVLKARERQLDVQSSILSKQNEIVAKQNMGNQLSQAIGSAASTSSASMPDPVVRAIEGIGRRMYATLQMGDGNLVDVQAGDTLSNGMRVVKISANEVVVMTKSRHQIHLAASYVPHQTAFNPNVPAPGLAPPPPAPPQRGATR
jgi:type IV pilus biogenesis protein PilP